MTWWKPIDHDNLDKHTVNWSDWLKQMREKEARGEYPFSTEENTMASIKSPIIWFGGKSYMLGEILPLIPNHHCYVEPFGGGASVLLAKPRSKVEVYNDLDSAVVNFFRMLDPDNPDFDRFINLCRINPMSRELYDEYKKTWDDQPDMVKQVCQWFFMARQSFNGGAGKGGWNGGNHRNRAAQIYDAVERLPEIADRLRKVQLENNDWETVVKRYDSERTFFYMDPPYVHSTRKSGGYTHEMTDDDHERLIARICTLKGKVLISGYPNPIYDKLDWQRTDLDASCFSAHGSGAETERIECLWRNYDAQLNLF